MNKSNFPRGKSRTSARRHARRGVLVVGMVFGFFILLTGAALVLNWTFLSMVHTQMQEQTDLLAESAVVELLDENLLQEIARDHTDDLADAQAAAEALRAANAAQMHPRLALDSGDLDINAYFVDDVTIPADGANLVSGPLTDPHNSLRVRADRDPGGANPVQVLVRGLGLETVRIHTESLATLDSRVVGFLPTDLRPTPLVPMAIESDAWFVDRVAANDDTFNANGRKELDLTLESFTGGGSFNSLLIDFDGGGPDFGPMPGQITAGIVPADLSGPDLMSGDMLDATEESPADPDTDAIVAAFNAVAASSDPRRIFPIYTTYAGGTVTITGFVAADVLEAENIGGAGDGQIRVRVEPVFIVHVTAITDPAEAENVYIHKIRLTR